MPSLLDRLMNGDNDTGNVIELDDEFPAELREEIVPDPTPGKSRSARPARATSPARPAVSAAAKKKVTLELDAYIKMAALAWSIKDQHCGPVLNEQSRAIAESIAELISRNPALVQWVETSGMLTDWAKLAMAIGPVVSAFRQHHIVRSVQDDEGGDDAPDYSRYAAYRPSA